MRDLVFIVTLATSCTNKQADERSQELATLRAEVAALQGKLTSCEQSRAAEIRPSLGAVRAAVPEIAPQLPGVFGILGRAYTDAEATQIRRDVLWAMSTRADAMSRTLGYDIRNAKGQIEPDMANRVVRDFRRRAIKLFGKVAALKVLRNQWGDLAGSAIYNADDSELSAIVP